MDFRLFRTFDAVASFMNFNHAARALHCTQSTVSAQIKLLEESLGVRLFERLGRRIALTASGLEFQRHVRRLLNYEREIRVAVKKAGETVGLISLRAPQSVSDQHLPTILRRFASSHPRVGFDVSNCGYFQLAEDLRSGAIDVGFLLSMTIESADLCSTVELIEPMAFVTNPTSKLVGRSKIALRALAEHTLLLAKHDCAYRMELERILKEKRVEPSSVIELNSLSAVIQCLKAGIGIAYLPQSAVARELHTGELQPLDLQEPLAAVKLHLLLHRDKPLTGAYGAFIRVVRQYFAELRAKTRRQLHARGI